MNSVNTKAAALVAIGVMLVGIAVRVPANAENEAFVCMEDTQEKCDYENKNLELFIKGRDAFERGREMGDLGEAHKIARELMDRKDSKHGNALMKFIYLQVGQGDHKNIVEAYRWIEADLAAGVSYARLDLQRIRDKLLARMTPEQAAEVSKQKN
jgi:hypothetical protein